MSEINFAVVKRACLSVNVSGYNGVSVGKLTFLKSVRVHIVFDYAVCLL